jgi:hypothetical protein
MGEQMKGEPLRYHHAVAVGSMGGRKGQSPTSQTPRSREGYEEG